ncbi:uncharacterized protein CG1161-like isoform X2 [Limulus polyphemus]|uniref:Uncharacterized protein CG1161-like isoform X2 n=1 Tax=Limulus polyphemus TaxID=6850 RepID=A0ABM1B7U5_LIMPO|nr:uncharacterized protein CG1161-like isoform X2 [Limulus polyphemus]
MNSSCIIVSFSVLIIWLSSNVHKVLGQYSDIRCKCVCPSTEVVNGSKTERNLYIGNVPPDECNCDGVVLSQIGYDLKNKEREFCPRCECHYESRNTTTIRVVVIIIIWAVSLLVVYMLFLMCLDPLLNKKRSTYEEYRDEEEPVSPVTPHQSPTPTVFNRVGQQQDKWKRQVQEQRRHIYDRHTMLN